MCQTVNKYCEFKYMLNSDNSKDIWNRVHNFQITINNKKDRDKENIGQRKKKDPKRTIFNFI